MIMTSVILDALAVINLHPTNCLCEVVILVINCNILLIQIAAHMARVMRLLFIYFYLLHYALAKCGAVYCNRPSVCMCVCLFVGQLPR